MAQRTAYDEQLSAMEDVYGAKRRVAKEDITQEDIDAWGRLAEGYGMSGGNIVRVQRLFAREYATRIGGVNAEERMFFANVRRAEEERKKQVARNWAVGIGTGLGVGAQLFGLPGGAGLGGMLGGLVGGFMTGEMEPGVGALGVETMDSIDSGKFRQSLNDLLAAIRNQRSALEPLGPNTGYEQEWSGRYGGAADWMKPPEAD